MRPSLGVIVLAVLMSACSVESGGSTSAPPEASARPTTSMPTSPSPPASAGPDWSAVEHLDTLVVERLPLEEGRPWLSLATVIGPDIWWPNGNEGGQPEVARLRADTMEVTAAIELGGNEGVFPPDAWGSAPSANGVWVPLAYQNAVALIDPGANEVARRLEVDATPYAIVEDGHNLWIADWENSEVLRVDIPSGEETLRIAGITEPTAIAVGDEGLWVNEHSGTEIVRLDPETGDELARVEVGGRPGMLPGLGSVWAWSDDERLVMRIDPATNRVVSTVPLPSNPTGAVIVGDSVWVSTGPQRGSCERNSYLVRIDPATNAADGLMEVPCLFGVMTDGKQLYAGTASESNPVMLRLEP